jgi:hypothetical protein
MLLFPEENKFVLNGRIILEYTKRSYPCIRPWRPAGLRDVNDPTLLENPLTDGTEIFNFRSDFT